jgi:hypothetical protein
MVACLLFASTVVLLLRQLELRIVSTEAFFVPLI